MALRIQFYLETQRNLRKNREDNALFPQTVTESKETATVLEEEYNCDLTEKDTGQKLGFLGRAGEMAMGWECLIEPE